MSKQLGLGRASGFLFHFGLASFSHFVGVVHGSDDRKVHDDGYEQELHEGGNNGTEVNDGVVATGVRDHYGQRGSQAFRIKERPNQWVENALNERVDDCRESSTNDNGDCKVDNIATQYKCFESAKHFTLLYWRCVNYDAFAADGEEGDVEVEVEEDDEPEVDPDDPESDVDLLGVELLDDELDELELESLELVVARESLR